MPQHREHVELGTAVGVYAVTAGVTALAAPLAAWALDERDEFPLFATLGISVASGFIGWSIASLASISLSIGGDCGFPPSELYAERVALLDLVPLSLAGAPTLIAWSLSEASTEPEAPRARLSIGALADPRDHLLVLARLEL